jgi:2'-5' RNA ligase superfamily protein
VVLWPEPEASERIRGLWEALSAEGIPTLATETHCSHLPHLSLLVAHGLAEHEALEALGPVPARPLPLLINSCGVFPPGVLFLACAATPELLAEQRRVHDAVVPLARNPWPDYAPGVWTPHITISWALGTDQLAQALPIVLAQLPITGWFTSGGVEDGATGERWASPAG